MNKRIKKIIFIFLIIYIFLGLCNSKTFARTIDTNIDAIDESVYPGVKAQIKALQAKHPNWTFKVEYTNLTWEEVINGEHQGHSTGTNPSNLVTANSSSYGGLWICEICGKQRYDTGSWYCASKEALEYMIDPRNSINETDIFQFMQLSGSGNFDNDTVKNTLKQMASKYPLIDDECINATIKAANECGVDPYYIMAKILEEQSATSPLYTGSGITINGQVMYKDYYNVLNIGATATTGNRDDVLLNGLAFAATKGWTTKTASIVGGVQIIASGYIAGDQDTLYYQKYDVIGDSKFQHQYQQNILGAQTAGSNLRTIYLKYDSSLSGNYSFIIPLYKYTPSTACKRPATNQEHTINSGVKMGDVNGDGQIGFADIVLMVNHIRGTATLSGNNLLAAKLARESTISFKDIVVLVNIIRGTAVAPSSSYQTATMVSYSKARLSPSGIEFAGISEGASIKVLKLATEQVCNIYWDLVVSSTGVYGYIPRYTYQ